jgi:NADH:ubiquinone oxidoreductase subunit 4 (subunit M)
MPVQIRLLGLIVSSLISLFAISLTLASGALEITYSTIVLHEISTLFVILTSLIFPAAILASYNNIVHNEITYYTLMILLEVILLYLFITNNVILFYVTFELSLLPLYLLIGLFGASQARVRASLLL